MDVSLENAEFPDRSGISRLPKVQGGLPPNLSGKRTESVTHPAASCCGIWAIACIFSGAVLL